MAMPRTRMQIGICPDTEMALSEHMFPPRTEQHLKSLGMLLRPLPLARQPANQIFSTVMGPHFDASDTQVDKFTLGCPRP
jgi:hypothetical protein